MLAKESTIANSQKDEKIDEKWLQKWVGNPAFNKNSQGINRILR
jgi:hypothetical protein